MDDQKARSAAASRQENRSDTPTLDLLVAGVFAVQLLVLARSYHSDRRRNRRTLKWFFWFVAREQAA